MSQISTKSYPYPAGLELDPIVIAHKHMRNNTSSREILEQFGMFLYTAKPDTTLGDLASEVLSIVEEEIIDEIRIEVEGMREVSAPKWAPLYRKHNEYLRTIAAGGNGCSDEARELLQEISLEQTMPFGELEAYSYMVQDGQYLEQDSYTGEWVSDEEATEIQLGKVPYTPAPDALTGRIIDEYREMGIDENTISLATQASQYDSYIDGDEEYNFEDGEDITVAIIQGQTQEMVIDAQNLYDLRKFIKVERQALFDLRSEFFKEMKAEADFQKTLPFHLRKAPVDWSILWRIRCDQSNERESYISRLQHAAYQGFEAEVLCREFLSMQDDWMLKIVDAELIHLPQFVDMNPMHDGIASLMNFIIEWGDVIIDQDLDGLTQFNTSDAEAYVIATHLEDELLASFPSDGPVEHSQAYMRGVLHATAAGKSDLKAAGYDAWREEQSPEAAEAYRREFNKAIEAGASWSKANSKGWQAFNYIARVKTVKPQGLEVETCVKHDVLIINYGLAAWKLNNSQLSLNPVEKARLKDILTSKGWGAKLVSVL